VSVGQFFSVGRRRRAQGNALSVLAKRMARSSLVGEPSAMSASTFQTQDRSLPTFGVSFISGMTVCSLPRKAHDA